MIYSNKAYDIGMVELAAVVTFTLEAFLKSSSLLRSHLAQLDQDGMYFLNRTHGSTILCLENSSIRSSPGSNFTVAVLVKMFLMITFYYLRGGAL